MKTKRACRRKTDRKDVTGVDSHNNVERRARKRESWGKGNTLPFFKSDLSFLALVLRLTLVCKDMLLPGCTPRRDFWLLCGVPFRGETYGRGDDASDVRETGDWLECWAETGRHRTNTVSLNEYQDSTLAVLSSWTAKVCSHFHAWSGKQHE